MKGVIILPKYLESFWIPNDSNFNSVLSANAVFFYSMRDTFGFELRYANEVDVGSDTNIVFMFGVPYHNRPKLIPGLLELQKNTKLVMWPGDIHCYESKECYTNKLKVFDRCDLILTPVHEFFMKLYPQFIEKYRLMPKFFAPDERYTRLSINKKPIIKCLLSGSLNPDVYPLRSFLVHKENVDYKAPIYVGDNYARLLHSYFCCVATPSIFNYALSKCFEIPAAGSLLLTRETADLKKAGFVANKHFIPIDRTDVLVKIKQCIENPEDYMSIRRQGMEFVRKNHSVNNRMVWLKEIFSELMGE